MTPSPSSIKLQLLFVLCAVISLSIVMMKNITAEGSGGNEDGTQTLNQQQRELERGVRRKRKVTTIGISESADGKEEMGRGHDEESQRNGGENGHPLRRNEHSSPAHLSLEPKGWCSVTTFTEAVERITFLDAVYSPITTSLLAPPPTTTVADGERLDHHDASSIAAAAGEEEGGTTAPPLLPVTDLYGNLRLMLDVFMADPIATCLAKVRRIIRDESGQQQKAGNLFNNQKKKAQNKHQKRRLLFIDMGSRSADQTTMFLNRFPDANSYEIHCFEANPAFNKFYRHIDDGGSGVGGGGGGAGGSDGVGGKSPNVIYHNEAVGVTNTSMWLSDRDVGSSIVDGKGQDGSGVMAKVIDFSHFFIQLNLNYPSSRLGAAAAASSSSGNSDILPLPAKTIVKMDIEKMEYSVLVKMLRTGAFLFVDDLLLECHYTTNKPKGPSRPVGAIGKDDCKDLIQQMNAAMNKGEEEKNDDGSAVNGAGSPFEAVFWNSVKTAKPSGYIQRHGGFLPT